MRRGYRLLVQTGAATLAVVPVAGIATSDVSRAAPGDDGTLTILESTTIDTLTGEVTPGTGTLGFLEMSGQTPRRVFELTSLVVGSGAVLRFVGPYVPVVEVTGTARIDGTISVSAIGDVPGAGGGAGGRPSAQPPGQPSFGGGGHGFAGGAGGSFDAALEAGDALGQAGEGPEGGAAGMCGGQGGGFARSNHGRDGHCRDGFGQFGLDHVGGGGGGGGGFVDRATGIVIGGSGGGAGAAGPDGSADRGGAGAGALVLSAGDQIRVGGSIEARPGPPGSTAGFAGPGGQGGGGAIWLRAPRVALTGSISAYGDLFTGTGVVAVDADCFARPEFNTVWPEPTVVPFDSGGAVPNDDDVAIDEDSTLTVAAPGVLGNDCGSGLTASVALPPAHGSVSVAPDGGFVYVPAPDFHGVDSFTYALSADGGDAGAATVSVVVASINDAPRPTGDAYEVGQGDVLSIAAETGLLANDHDPEGDPIVVDLTSLPTHGLLSMTQDGSFTYTPAAGFRGVDTFTYRAFDNFLVSPEVTVSITVAAVGPERVAIVQQPIDADGSSSFAARRGVVPVKFRLTAEGTPTCELPAATISLSRLGGTSGAAPDESTYLLTADSGPAFDVTDCTYHYNLATKPLGPGRYRVAALIDGVEVGAALFELR